MNSTGPDQHPDLQGRQGLQVGHHNVQHNTFYPHGGTAWPTRVGIVPRLADGFQPRKAIADLTAATIGRHAVGAASATPVVSGMGGVGKTQLAIYYAERLWATKQLDLLVWITATSRQAVIDGYAQAAIDLALRGAHGIDGNKDAARFHAWLATTTKRWVVVLDDLSVVADLQGLWPPKRPTGHAIVTTRLRDPVLAGPDRHLISVDVFTPAEASAYLHRRLAHHPQLADNLEDVAADLGYLPLALSQAAAFILGEEILCSTYRRRFADRSQSLDDLVPLPDRLPDDYTRPITAALSLSIEAAERDRPAGLAEQLLHLASVLDPAGIPIGVFTSTAAGNWLATHFGAVNQQRSSVDIARAGLRILHRLNVITYTGDRVAVHALVQRAVRDRLTDDVLAEVIRIAADALLEAWPTIYCDSRLAQTLRANAAALFDHHPTALLAFEGHALRWRVPDSLHDSGNPGAAAAAYRQLLIGITRVLGPHHPDTLATRHNLARSLGEAGHTAFAATALEKLLVDIQQVCGPDHPDTLAVRVNLTGWQGRAGDVAKAARTLEELLPDVVRVIGADHPDTLFTRSCLALWRGEAGDPATAITILQDLLTDQQRILGPDHPDTLATRHNLARWRGESGDPTAATTILQDLLTDQQQILGPEHPHTLATRHNLTRWRGELINEANTITDLKYLLADTKRVLGPAHPYTLTTRHNLALWQGRSGDATVAVCALQALLIDQQQILGPDHPDTLLVRGNLAHWQGIGGDAARAVAALENLLSDRQRVLGPHHAHTRATRYDLVYWQKRMNVQVGFPQIRTNQAKMRGPDHPHIQTTRHTLSYWQNQAPRDD
jgi:hypothetical protein